MAQSEQLSPEKLWSIQTETWYPGLLENVYCVPPLHFRHVPYKHAVVDERNLSETAGSGEPSPTGACGTGSVTSVLQLDPPGSSSSCRGSKCCDELPRVQESDINDDYAQQHMLTCLKHLGESRKPEPMFLISQLRFRDFLKRSSSFPPLPEGEFDIAMVTLNAVGVGELKSIGLKYGPPKKEKLLEKVNKSVNQLKQQKSAMEKMVGGVDPALPIQPFLMLPYIPRNLLKAAISSDKRKMKDLCKFLGANNLDEAIKLCLCKDDLDNSTPERVPQVVIRSLRSWFQRRFKAKGALAVTSVDRTQKIYKQLVSRLAGPATAIYVHCPTPPLLEVRTVSQAVSLVGERMAPQLGDRMSQIVLTPDQVKLLNAAPRLAWLTGPPGTGKTITAVVRGLVWLKQGFEVHVVTFDRVSLAASNNVYHMLAKTIELDSAQSPYSSESTSISSEFSESDSKSSDFTETSTTSSENPETGSTSSEFAESVTMPSVSTDVDSVDTTDSEDTPSSAVPVGNPHLHTFDFFYSDEDVLKAVEKLKEAMGLDNSLRVIVDECDRPDHDKVLERHQRFFRQLITLGSEVHIWATSVDNNNLPDQMKAKEYKMTQPLRCPPSVLSHVEPAVNQYADSESQCDKYSAPVFPAVSDGPPTIWLNHKLGDGHSNKWPVQCQQCGVDLAKQLDALKVGKDVTYMGVKLQPECQPPPIKLSDVVVLTYSSELSDDCPFVQGLRLGGISRVCVLPWKNKTPASEAEKGAVKKLATGEIEALTVAHPFWVKGLEKKIVVIVPGRHATYEASDEDWMQWDQLYSMSRCTSQLIIITCPGHPLQKKN